MRPINVCRFSLAACAAIGVCFMLVGVVLVPTLPHLQLDVVLTPQQLAEVETRESTLALLKRASGKMWFFWSAAGLVVTLCAGIGLAASRRVG
jgi:hypothetical protein